MNDQLKYEREVGRARANGAADVIAKWLIGLLLVAVLFRFADGPDDTETSVWNPSGVRPVTDHLTGCQYLRAPGGGITPRVGTNCFPKGSK